jgi:hypothetical protein
VPEHIVSARPDPGQEVVPFVRRHSVSEVTFIVHCAAGADTSAIFRHGLNWHKYLLSMTVRS